MLSDEVVSVNCCGVTSEKPPVTGILQVGQSETLRRKVTWCWWSWKNMVDLPSGKHTKSYWTWPLIVDLPIKHGDFP